MLALHGGLSFIVQNQQLLHISANAPEGLRLICTGNEMRWIDTAATQKQGRLVFAHLPAMSHGPGQSFDVAKHSDHQLHTDHRHHTGHQPHTDHRHHTGHQLLESHQPYDSYQKQASNVEHQKFTDDLPSSLAFADLACPEQIFSELQNSLGFSVSTLLLSFSPKQDAFDTLPDTPCTRLHYPSNLSRAPPAVTV